VSFVVQASKQNASRYAIPSCCFDTAVPDGFVASSSLFRTAKPDCNGIQSLFRTIKPDYNGIPSLYRTENLIVTESQVYIEQKT
jgi:hypothetical protein